MPLSQAIHATPKMHKVPASSFHVLQEPENEWRYQCYGVPHLGRGRERCWEAILEWAEDMMRYLLPGGSFSKESRSKQVRKHRGKRQVH